MVVVVVGVVVVGVVVVEVVVAVVVVVVVVVGGILATTVSVLFSHFKSWQLEAVFNWTMEPSLKLLVK